MLVDGAEKAVVSVEAVDVLAPEVCRRQHQTVVLGEQRFFVRSLDVLDVQAEIAQGHVRFVVVDDLQQLEHLEERAAEGIGEREILLPRQHNTSKDNLLDINERRLDARPRQRRARQERRRRIVLPLIRINVFVISCRRLLGRVVCFGCCRVLKAVWQNDFRGNFSRQGREVEEWVAAKGEIGGKRIHQSTKER
jgi:hypothetical protein